MKNSAFCLDSEPEIQKILYHDFKKLVCIKFVVCLLSVVPGYFFCAVSALLRSEKIAWSNGLYFQILC